MLLPLPPDMGGGEASAGMGRRERLYCPLLLRGGQVPPEVGWMVPVLGAGVVPVLGAGVGGCARRRSARAD